MKKIKKLLKKSSGVILRRPETDEESDLLSRTTTARFFATLRMTTVRVFQQPVKRAVQIILGLIFMVSSIYKIMTPLDFAHAIYNYQLLPGWMINPMAIVLPWVQLIAGSALVFRRGERGAGLLILLMMISFQAAVAVALFRGLSIVCGCFEPGGSPATWRTFGRDSVILILAAANFLSHLRQQPLDSRLKVES